MPPLGILFINEHPPESAAKAKKVFESADILIRQAERKLSLLRDTARVAAVVDAIKNPLKAQQ